MAQWRHYWSLDRTKGQSTLCKGQVKSALMLQTVESHVQELCGGSAVPSLPLSNTKT